MPPYVATALHTQNELLMSNLIEFYNKSDHMRKMISIINGESKISLRIVDWFVTNYAKKYYTVYSLETQGTDGTVRFKVYNDYKLKLKAYAKRRFDPFCRWERVSIPYDNTKSMETTIGQLNFFKWAIENKIIDYIEDNYIAIEKDMNSRNSTAKRNTPSDTESMTSSSNNSTPNSYTSSDSSQRGDGKTRKKREELSESACKCIKKENISVIVKFN